MTINQSFVKVADNIGFKFGVIKITRYFTTNLDCDQKCQLFMTEPTQFICYYFCLLGFVSPIFVFDGHKYSILCSTDIPSWKELQSP